MKTARISFFSLLKKYFCFYWNGSTAFLVREARCVKKSIFEKIQKSPKKSKNPKKEVRFLWDVSKRLHKIDIGKKRDSFLRETEKSASLLHKSDFILKFEKCPKMAFFDGFSITFLLHCYRDPRKTPCREVHSRGSLYKSLKNIRGQFSKMDIFKMSKNENCEIIFFLLTEKLFLFLLKLFHCIFGKRDERRQKVNFQKNPKKSEKIRKSQKRGEISLRRLKMPT